MLNQDRIFANFLEILQRPSIKILVVVNISKNYARPFVM